MKKLFLLLLALSASKVYAQSTSSTWIDVTAPPYSAKNDCSADAAPAINSAIAGAPAGSGVIVFPTGCYLIDTQISDTNSAALLTYLGEGNVQLQASNITTPPSIIQFGNDSTSVGYRKIKNLYFNCNTSSSSDGIDLDGLHHSEFYDVTIASCSAGLRTTGTNTNNVSDRFFGGAIYTGSNGGDGIVLGNGANSWSFFGTRVVGASGASSCCGSGIDFEGYAGAFYGVQVSGWLIGIRLQGSNANGIPPQQGGMLISGSYLTNNTGAAIYVGGSLLGDRAAGLSITGNYIDCNNFVDSNGVKSNGIYALSAMGFNFTANQIRQCPGYSILGVSDGSGDPYGADNGFVGANSLDPGANVTLLGGQYTITSSLSTKSSNYTLRGADSQVNVTGNTAITVPHVSIAQQWTVFNSGTGNVALACDSGTINGQTSISLAPFTGKIVSTDGTNCFAL